MTYTETAERVSPRRQVNVTEPIPGRDAEMVRNAAGGYTFDVGLQERLKRFLILGSEGGTYYAGEQDHSNANANVVIEALHANGPETVEIIREVSVSGRAPSNDPALFALALATVPEYANEETRRLAFERIPLVARTGTHLFTFVSIVDRLRGWGRGLRNGVAAWYEDKTPQQAAYQAVKYRQREDWSHRDVLRLSHPAESDNGLKNNVYDWICGRRGTHDLPDSITAYERAQAAKSVEDTVALIEQFDGALPHEAINTDHKTDPRVWEALLNSGMPMGALVRNLANMTRYGLLTPGSDATQIVIDKLNDEDYIKRSRLHPLGVLNAVATYQSGEGQRGVTWIPVNQIIDALDGAFYKAFDNVEPTGKRRLIAIDVSGSMWGRSGGWGFPNCITGTDRNGRPKESKLPPRLAAGAMAMVSLKTGDPTNVVAFSSPDPYQSGIMPVSLSGAQRLDDVLNRIASCPPGGTDCSLPMEWAINNAQDIDSFEIYTDAEAWRGNQPMQALNRYRQVAAKPDAKLTMIGMTATRNTIGDPDDRNVLDVVGFDSSAPALIADFVAGRV